MIYRIADSTLSTESSLRMTKEELNNLSVEEKNKIDSMVTISSLTPSLLNEYKLAIPREYARGESEKIPENPESVPHYELYVERQIGTSRNRRSTYIYYRLPKSGRLVAIEIFANASGVDFLKRDHKYILRETDELDRRIILGFCMMYINSLLHACYSDKPDLWLKANARNYNASKMPKRLKRGKIYSDMSSYYKDLKPYEECGIFKSLQFI